MCSKVLTMDDLCDDVLQYLFDNFVDITSKLKARMVCKRFNAIITDSFNRRQSLIITDISLKECFNLKTIVDQKVAKYSVLDIKELSHRRNGFWLRNKDKSLKLLTSLDICMLSIRKFHYLKHLCLLLTNKCSLRSVFKSIADNSNENSSLETLIIVVLKAGKFSITNEDMTAFCHRFNGLKHFQIYTDSGVYAPEECFTTLINKCQLLEVFKMEVNYLLNETHDHSDDNYFTGNCFKQIGPNIKSIEVSKAVFDDKAIHSMTSFESLKNLKHLKVGPIITSTMLSICNKFESLSSLDISIDFQWSESKENTKKFFSCVRQLQCLRELSITWFGKFKVIPNEADIDFHTFDGFKICKNLRVLVIKNAILSSDSMKAMAKHLPQLEVLGIIVCDITKETLKPIDRFVNLKKIRISGRTDDKFYDLDVIKMNDTFIDELILKCNDLHLFTNPTPEPKEPEEQPELNLEYHYYKMMVDGNKKRKAYIQINF